MQSIAKIVSGMMPIIKDPLWVSWTDEFLSLSGEKVQDLSIRQRNAKHLLCVAEHQETPGSWLLKTVLDDDFVFSVIKFRAKRYDLTITQSALMFIQYLSSSPAMGVMWVHALKRLEVKTGEKVTMLTLEKTFPNGFPTDEAMSMMWQKQKHLGGAMDNYLDTVILEGDFNV